MNGVGSGFTYDGAGNVLYDGLNSYLYDLEGRLCAVKNSVVGTMTGYVYDADGTRVAKGTISTWSCDPGVSGFTPTNDYILGPGGEQVTEMGMGSTTNGSTTTGLAWQHTNVYAAGTLIATYDNDGLHFYLNDPLGTRRAQTDYAGVLEQTCSSLPFGDGLACTGSTVAPTEHHFTGKERDSESGNDYFGARYYSSAMGRFMSPDWSAKQDPVPYAKLDDPQSLNLYSYVENNPLDKTDPTGHLGCGFLWLSNCPTPPPPPPLAPPPKPPGIPKDVPSAHVPGREYKTPRPPRKLLLEPRIRNQLGRTKRLLVA